MSASLALEPILEMENFSYDAAAALTYPEDISPAQKTAKEVRERLIPRKPVSTPEIGETPKFEPENGQPPNIPLGRPQGYEHIQPYEGPEGNRWLPGFWVQFPWLVILPLVLCLACLSAAISILVRSDGDPVAHWSISPPVWLALFTTILNVSLRYAFKQGVAISWWHKAIRGGTVKDLHKRWSSGDGVWSAIGAGRHFSLVSLGSIAATLIVIDQPLIQRASTIVSTPRSYLTNVTAAIAPEIPWGYTGFQPARLQNSQVMTQPMIVAFNGYNTQAPIISDFSGCRDKCQGFVEAGGLAAQCSTISGPVQYLQSSTFRIGLGPDATVNNDVYSFDSPFNVNFTLIGTERGNNDTASNTQILMVVAYTNQSTTACTGNRVQRTCSLRPATIKYPVTIENGTLNLGDLINDATVQSFQSSTTLLGIDGDGELTEWTLGGIYTAATSLFNSNATYGFNAAVASQLLLEDTLSNQFLDITPGPDQPNLNSTEGPGVLASGLSYPTACNSNWTDPTNHIISALNQIAFRVSLGAATFPYRDTNKAPVPQVVTMLATSNINVFHSEHKYLIAMVVLTVAMMGLVVPTFVGWWELGRHVTMDPIEIAKAFEAPLLQGPGSNAPTWQLVQDYGKSGIRYGEPVGYSDSRMMKRTLKLGNPHEVRRPTTGAIYE